MTSFEEHLGKSFSNNANEENYSLRLTRLFAKYASDQLDKIPALLEEYRGREEDVIRTLVAKLGPEPFCDAPTLECETSVVAAASPRGPGEDDSAAATSAAREGCVGGKCEGQRAEEAAAWLERLSLPSSVYRRHIVDLLGEERVSGLEDRFGVPRLLYGGNCERLWVVVANAMGSAQDSSNTPVLRQIHDDVFAENVSANFACFLLILETVQFPLPKKYEEKVVFCHYPLCTLIRDRDRHSLQTSVAFFDLIAEFEMKKSLLFNEEKADRQCIEKQIMECDNKRARNSKEKSFYKWHILNKAIEVLPELEEGQRNEIKTLERIEFKTKYLWFKCGLCDVKETSLSICSTSSSEKTRYKKVVEWGDGKKGTPGFSLSSSSPQRYGLSYRLASTHFKGGLERVKHQIGHVRPLTTLEVKDRRLLPHQKSKPSLKNGPSLTEANTSNRLSKHTSRDKNRTLLKATMDSDFEFLLYQSPLPKKPDYAGSSTLRVLRFSSEIGKSKKKAYKGREVDVTGRDKWGPAKEGRLSEVAPPVCHDAYEAVLLDEDLSLFAEREALSGRGQSLGSTYRYCHEPCFFKKEKNFSCSFWSDD